VAGHPFLIGSGVRNYSPNLIWRRHHPLESEKLIRFLFRASIDPISDRQPGSTPFISFGQSRATRLNQAVLFHSKIERFFVSFVWFRKHIMCPYWARRSEGQQQPLPVHSY
jgi:hypothetical protein